MTNEEIEKKLKEMSELSEKERPAHLQDIAKEYGVYNFSADGALDTYTLFKNIHIYLQSKLMLNACVSAETSSDLAKQACNSAKWSCIWAATAAIAACITVILTLCLGQAREVFERIGMPQRVEEIGAGIEELNEM